MSDMVYFEDDTNAHEWEEQLVKDVSFDLFRCQEQWIDMVGDNGPGTNPRVREKFIEKFDEFFDRRTAFLRDTLMLRMLQEYMENDIDLDPEVAWTYNDMMGYAPGEEGYVEGVSYSEED